MAENVLHAYKLFRVRADGSIGSLLIDTGKRLETGVWYRAEDHRPRWGKTSNPGWHAVMEPNAPHLARKDGRAWYRVDLRGVHPVRKRDGSIWLRSAEMRIVERVDNETAHR